MRIETILGIAGVLVSLVSAILSWYFAKQSRKHAQQTLELSKSSFDLDKNTKLNQYVDEALNVWKQEGTAVDYITTLSLDEADAEEIWQRAYLRKKGKTPLKTFRQTKE